MSRRIASFLLACGALAAPITAGADYLYSVFREDCTIDTTIRYSAADPIVATVHLEKSEVNRVSSNYMTWGGFSLHSDGSSFRSTTTNGVTVKELVKARGHLYALRLFKEKAPDTNQWEFMPYDQKTVLEDCGPDKTCLFDAGKMLTDRHKRDAPRRIYGGRVGTPLDSDEAGAYSVPIAETVPLVLDGLPSSSSEYWPLELWWSGYGSAEAGAEATVAVTNFREKVWKPWSELGAVQEALAGGLPKGLHSSVNESHEITTPRALDLGRVLKWLHGETRGWDLGDVYHASAAVVEPPERQYRDRSYPPFKQAFKERPEMIYVGANDGMIHGFYAAPDLLWKEQGCDAPRWQAGEEAWAYLPANLLAKSLVHVKRGDQRFFSQDLSCRFTDVMVDTEYRTCDPDDWKWPWQAGSDESAYCGWRTVLMCGQGWGGSWYVGLDVTDPLAPFRKDDGTLACTRQDRLPMRALWEMTHLPATDNAPAMGRTWSVPFIGLVNMETEPRWLAGFGSGYNSDMVNCPVYSKGSCSSNESKGEVHISKRPLAAFRVLNLEYDGRFPYHGDGVGDGDDTWKENASAFILDIANGEVLRRFDLDGQLAVVADIPAVDSDMNGLVDAAYVAGWEGALARIHFGDERTTLDGIGIGDGTNLCTVTSMSGQRVLANHPTAFGIPPRATDTEAHANRVMTVLGSGINSGDDPDMQRNNGNFWDIDARIFQDDGSAECPTTSSVVCGANSWWNVNDNDGPQKPRLLGAPIFSRQANGDDWLVYTTWSPPGSQCSREGYAKLWCLDVTEGNACKECNGFAGKGKSYNITLYAGEQPPSSPVAADGNIYVSGEDGPLKFGVENSDGAGPNANSYAPTVAVPARVTSWREVF